MALRFDFLSDHGVHRPQGIWAKEHFTTLSADIYRNIAQDIYFPLPVMDVFHSSRLYATFAEWTLRHDGILLRK